MNINDIYLQLVKNEIQVSEALALTQVLVPLSDEDAEWVSSEIIGFPDKSQLPEYRQLPCKVIARAKSNFTHDYIDIEIHNGGLDKLDCLLKQNFGLSIYKLYITQGLEWIEEQVANHDDGSIIMLFEGGPAQELKQSLAGESARGNFIVKDVFQSAEVHYAQNIIHVVKTQLIKVLKEAIRPTSSNRKTINDHNSPKKVVFISYSWESEEHKEWVHKLATDLSEEFEIKIDQDLPLGVELTSFMESSVASSDKVLIITTPTYKKKADNRERGVGYETSLITDEIVTSQNQIKFIPLIRSGSKEASYPRYLGSRKGLDMTDDAKYQDNLEVLKRNLHSY